jgi:hypothetical protein
VRRHKAINHLLVREGRSRRLGAARRSVASGGSVRTLASGRPCLGLEARGKFGRGVVGGQVGDFWRHRARYFTPQVVDHGLIDRAGAALGAIKASHEVFLGDRPHRVVVLFVPSLRAVDGDFLDEPAGGLLHSP